MESRKRSSANPVQKIYVKTTDKCNSYGDKLHPYPEQFEKYTAAFADARKKLLKAKSGLTAKSSSEDIELFDRLCSDTCIELQELSKELKRDAVGKGNI
jgi:hypothetical protein